MSHELKKLEKSQVELTITVVPADYQKDLEAAATRISERAAIKGFRAGKAPYDIVKEQMGELKIIEEAMESIVQKNYFTAVKAEKLDTIGMPEITIQKVAPGNDFVFTAKVALLPTVTLADLSKVKVTKKKVEVGDQEVDNVLNDLRKMQTKEVLKNAAAGKEDKIVVDMDMFLDKVPVDGGQAKGYQIYLSEPHYIPGMAEQLLGLKSGEEKEFSLKFPAEHYQKHLAGKDVNIKVKVKDVFELQLPEAGEEFAKALGQESMEKLRALLLANITHEAEHKEEQRLEIEILDKVIEGTEFSEIPEVLIKAEKQKMFMELKHNLEQQGIEMEKYLKDLKKTEEEIFKDFNDGAIKRAKAALVSRAVAKDNEIIVSDDELKKEIEVIRSMYKDNPQVEENLKRDEVRETIAATIQNRKVVEWLREKILGDKPKHDHDHDHSAPGHKCDHC